MDTADIKTIKIIDTPYDLEGKDIVCYPNLILLCKVSVPRLFMKPRIIKFPITVDLVKGSAAISDMYPESQEISIHNQSLIPIVAVKEEALASARQIIIKWVRHKFKAYKVPEIEIVKEEEIYKVFFYSEIYEEMVLIDSIKGLEM